MNIPGIEIGNELHDELHIIIDRIRVEVSPEASVTVYRYLIGTAKTFLENLTASEEAKHG